ncbi:MAG: Flavin reductase-like domain protein [Glaciihabitans sp.]|nr:Flavin reductase-like domain protein [Glaciihabitans sp.]
MTITHPASATGVHGFELASKDPAVLRAAFGRFPSGIAALSAVIDGVPTGLVATSFSVGVSFDPPIVLFSVQNSSTTWPVLRSAASIGASVLGKDHAAVCAQLASRTGDRFAGLDTIATDTGSLFIGGSSLLLDCEILSETPAGDHHIILLQVTAIKVEADMDPLVYHGAAFRQLVPNYEI